VKEKPAIKPIPDGYHSVTPYLMVKCCKEALAFYTKAFNAVEKFKLEEKGMVVHCEFLIGNSTVMMSDEMPDAKGGPTDRFGFCIYTEDCDKMFKQALDAGAKLDKELKDQFYGDRSGSLIDPFGIKWTVATHIEDVSPEKMKESMAKFAAEMEKTKTS